MKSGADPLFANLDAIADALGRLGPKAGKLNNKAEQVEGVDMKKLGGIARDYYFRSGIEAWTQMRKQLPEFLVSSGEAGKTVDQFFEAQMRTAAASAEKLSNAIDAAAIKIGTTQLGADKKKSEFEEAMVRRAPIFSASIPWRRTLPLTPVGRAATGSNSLEKRERLASPVGREFKLCGIFRRVARRLRPPKGWGGFPERSGRGRSVFAEHAGLGEL